ncbi:MAG: type II toxin-antitoxin system VapC family toxin [Actinomycetota bacterium]|nr:type II toxin-antitoxin system VapC family toxin [Actinomycetota bacterium]
MEIVLDASVGVKWFNEKNEEDVEIALEIQKQKILSKLEIIVPDLFFLEIINAFITRSTFATEDILIMEEALQKMNLKVVSPDHFILNEAIKVARDFNLTIYDSLYVAVANFYSTQLLTGDKKILQSRNKLGFIKPLKEFKKIL